MNQKHSELECIHHHLHGLGRTNPLELADMVSYSGWARLAQIELERRRSQVLIGLKDGELAMLADGIIDLAQEAGKVLEGLEV